MRRALFVYEWALALRTRCVRKDDPARTSAPRALLGAVLLAGLWPAAVAGQEVQFLTVTSRNTENVLEWVNPVGSTTVGIWFDVGDPCTPPPAVGLGNSLGDETGPDGGRDRFSHGSLTNGTTYCYSLFVKTGMSSYSLTARSNSGRPMDTTGPVKWAFSIGVTSLAAPTVGTAGIIATSNANVLHAMERGDLAPGGEWPALWLPKPLGALPVQSRSPIIPIDVGGANPVVYLGSQEGKVYAVDGVKGGAAVADPWDPVLPVPLGGLAGQAAPAGMFTAFGGTYDYLLVGTSAASDNRFYAIDPITGAEIDFFDNGGGGIGPINGMATVDYANNRVYFASEKQGGGAHTLWCLNLLPEPAPVFSLEWSGDFGTIYSSPVLMGGRIYVMEDIFLASVDAATGTFYDTNVNEGQAKEFIWPDWRNPGDIYFATATCVLAYHDDGTLNEKFGGCISLPGGAIPTSGVLVIDQRVYLGADDGKLHEVDLSGASPSFKSVQLGYPGPAPPPPAVGSPSFDWPNSLIHVGTEAGVFYAVKAPLP